MGVSDQSDFEKATQAAALAAAVLPGFLAILDKMADLIIHLHKPKPEPAPVRATQPPVREGQ